MQTRQSSQTEREELLTDLQTLSLFSGLARDQLQCLAGGEEIDAAPGEKIVQQGEISHHFWIILSGETRVFYEESVEVGGPVYLHSRGSTFGELPLLANMANPVTVSATEPTRLFRLDETAFWQMMTICPEVRRVILGNMSMRFRKMQSVTIQQEKMASLGTLAAGLMHELNNPGAAVKRAAAQLRESFLCTQQTSSSLRKRALSAEQQVCLEDLKAHILKEAPAAAMHPLEQSDAEDALSEWLAEAGVTDAWKIAPALATAGLTEEHLACARSMFSPEVFRESLGWVESFVASLRLVSVIEEGIGRVADLVHAVKSYAYEGRGQMRSIDVNQSIAATLLILGHKIREKNVTLRKEMQATLPPLESAASGLNQVWTNLLDNAIDAVAPEGHIGIETWSAASTEGREEIWIRVVDDGAGISQECQAHIFDPFYTTKAVGVGTGLGLGIAYRVVEQAGGTIRFASEPGRTEFLVRLPVAAHA